MQLSKAKVNIAAGNHNLYCNFVPSAAKKQNKTKKHTILLLSASRQILNSPLGLNKVSKCETKRVFNNLWQILLVTKSLWCGGSDTRSHQALSNLISWSFKSWWVHKATNCLPSCSLYLLPGGHTLSSEDHGRKKKTLWKQESWIVATSSHMWRHTEGNNENSGWCVTAHESRYPAPIEGQCKQLIRR